MLNRVFPQTLALLVFALSVQTDSQAVELNRGISHSTGRVAGLFRGIDEHLIDVTFIAQDAAKANVLVRNNTNEVLHIQLPSAFAAVPVLAQFGNGGGQNFAGLDGLGGQGQGGGAAQSVGGGINAGQGQGMGLGQGMQGQGMQFGGLMRIPPGKTRKLKASIVCLECGKPEPNPRLAYRIIPIESFSSDERVARLCARLGRGEIEQNTAQAAAWHLANGLTWNQLANINRLESRYLGIVPMFTKTDLDHAKSLVASMSGQAAGRDSYESEQLADE